MTKRKMLILIGIALLLSGLVGWVIWGNTALQVSSHTVSSTRIPAAFDGYRIAHLSDLHNSELGKDNRKLLSLLQKASPDLIVITGDMIDSRRTDFDIALQLAQDLVGIAPCCYVPGNHEGRIDSYERFKQGLTDAGVTVLENRTVMLEKEGQQLAVSGVIDPIMQQGMYLEHGGYIDGVLQEILSKEVYTLLLSHRPELFETYVKCAVDVVFCGHAHGGQIRLPFVGGLVAPGQGLFPRYDAGRFEKEETTMLVSRGIGNSLFPFRVNNRPEVILVTLGSI